MDKPMNRTIKVVEVKGGHREVGAQIGEACQQEIHHSIESARDLVNALADDLRINWNRAIIQARKYLPFVQDAYPQYLEELYGIAEGSRSSFEDVFTLNAFEGIVMDRLHLSKCTSLAVNQQRTEKQKVLVAHNEDWFPNDEEDVYLVKIVTDDEPPFLAMNYGGLLPNIGFNEAGIAQCCDTVYPVEKRVGIPRVVVGRAVLGARTISEAIQRAISPHRAAGYNHLIVHESGELYNVEVSANNFALLYDDCGYLAHTNHYLSPKMQAIEEDPDQLIGSHVRYSRALRMLKETENHTVNSLQKIQRDHMNYPYSICCHATEFENPFDREKTIAALVMDLSEKVMVMAWGNPCRNLYYSFAL